MQMTSATSGVAPPRPRGRIRQEPWGVGLLLIGLLLGLGWVDSELGQIGLERIHEAVGLLGLWTLIAGVPVAAVSSWLAGRGRLLLLLRWLGLLAFAGLHAVVGGLLAYSPVLCGVWMPAGAPCETNWQRRAMVVVLTLATWGLLAAVDGLIAHLVRRRSAGLARARKS